MFPNFRAFLVGAVLICGVTVSAGGASAQTVTSYASGMGAPASLSFDSSGALFSGGFNQQTIRRVAPAGGVGSVFLTRPSGQFGAVVGPDDALYTVLSNGNVIRYPSGSTTPDALPYGTGAPTSAYTNLAFDSVNRLYIVGNSTTNVYRIPAGGGPATVYATVPAAAPFAITIAADGRAFIAFESLSEVYSVGPGGGAATSFGTGIVAQQSYGIAVSAAGDVYVPALNANQIYRIPAAGGAAVPFAAIPGGPTGLTIKGGVLYAASFLTGEVRAVSLPAAGPTPVPTLSEWALILFGTILAGGAALYLQRRRMSV